MVEEVEINVTISEEINHALSARLLIGCIEFLLYQRQQLPLPFHELKRMVEDHERAACPAETSAKDRRFAKGFHNSEYRKAKRVYEDLETLFHHINKLFSSRTPVYSAAVLLGSTPVSPKEKYVVSFPSVEHLTSVDISSRACSSTCRKLVRCLIADQQLGSYKDICPTSMLVFVQARRTSEVEWFRPKPTFRLPYRGQSCKITLKTTRCGEEPMTSRTAENVQSSIGNGDDDVDDSLWFQAPVIIRGYRNRTGATL